ncbi:uncharacterized protein LOC9634084 isoform X1 [Selaginella moellendorffii]|uniref:uncharacterized protein LOC9634084 isoform X1 n=1 Tax=Selaginella moellendorffii TaxID=88036 RepID=UPI000D1C52A1|nr:uncharacterized protein LOC9634084 isoform X1 [Selaginella moellendorffii]|eukprot:XP_024526720.1 uncharacterized protein LOC9634084 isoform X1 [Selaginella moellendorffii]
MATPRPAVAQIQNFKQERKLTKCVTCGNTAMGILSSRCDFRACGTCCVRAKNPCQAHGFKQATGPMTPSTPEVSQPRPAQFQWAPGMGMSPYMRPPNGQVSSPYMNQMMRYRVPYTSPIVRMPAPPPVETEDQKEARLEKARKNFIYAQKEALMINSWRMIKMRAYADADLSFEDEAFDRYMRASTLLEGVVGLDERNDTVTEGIADTRQEDSLQAAVLARHDSRNSELQRQKLQKAIAKSFSKLRKKESESESMLEIREFNQQAGIGRRDTKRMKVQTPDGKECLRRINAWEDLFEGIGSFSSSGEMRNYLEQFSTREASKGEQVNPAASGAMEEKSSKIPPVRRLVTILMKQKQQAPVIPETQKEMELSDESLSKVYDNLESYTLEAL